MMRLLNIFLLFTLTFLCSCGPVYNYKDHYFPPDSFEGRNCINYCLRDKASCDQHCDYIEQNCKSNVNITDASSQIVGLLLDNKNIEQRHDLNRIESRNDSRYNECTRQKNYCKSNCLDNYKICYQNCGGAITTERYCTMFCEH